MRTSSAPLPLNRRPGLRAGGFTLVELLVVISIIAILAALLLPALMAVKKSAKIKQAQMEMSQIITAINGYDSAQSRMPCSTDAMTAAHPANIDTTDCTYGTGGLVPITITLPGGGPANIPATGYMTNNAELMAILLDLENYGDGRPTINKGHVKNPSRTKFLNAKFVSDKVSPGVGIDGVYRDPWGNPYIITIDLNSDDKARDTFYSLAAVSQDPADPNRGLNGLYKTVLPISRTTVFEANTPVMVWSAGPDKMVDPTVSAKLGANKDNVLSWK